MKVVGQADQPLRKSIGSKSIESDSIDYFCCCDTTGNPVQHADPLEQITRFAYGPHSRLPAMTDARSNILQ
ncbi:MAG: hypothetical protein D3909_09140 [Candidatus Electrothrix sp. ATG1]|nr:hypothetical protein [Candidatus Electrothrix sp. ATG1]